MTRMNPTFFKIGFFRVIGLIPSCIQVDDPGLRPVTPGVSEEPIGLAKHPVGKHPVRTTKVYA
jgi:hypothetical protein